MDETYERIERYVSATLPEAEQQAFETECLTDPALMQELTQYLASHRAARELAETKKKQEWITAYKNQPKTFQLPAWTITAAAILGLLILSYGGYRQFFHVSSPEDLFSANFGPLPPAIVRGDTSQDKQLWNQAMDHYQAGRYEAAVDLLQQYRTQVAGTADTSQAHMYLGESFLLSHAPERAIEAYQSVDAGSQYIHEAQWHLALAYLSRKKPESALPILQRIADNAHHPFRSAAAELRHQLEQK